MPNRSFILLIGLLLPLSNLLHAQSSLALSSASVAPGGATALNLSLSSDPSNKPAALEWTFSYPTASVATLKVNAGPALSAAGKSVSCAAGANSYTCVAWGLNSNPISDGVVATLSLTLSGSNGLPVAIDNSLGASLAGDEIAVTGTGGVVSVTAVTGITSLTCTPASLAPNASSTCTVTLNGPGGGIVGLSSSTANLTVPASLTIPTGSLSGTFTATATAFTADQSATITATLNGSSPTRHALADGAADSLVPAMHCRKPRRSGEHHLHRHPLESRRQQHHGAADQQRAFHTDRSTFSLTSPPMPFPRHSRRVPER